MTQITQFGDQFGNKAEGGLDAAEHIAGIATKPA